MKKIIYIIITLFCFSSTLYAQQDPTYTFYRYHMNVINPAYAGSSQQSLLSLGVRSQWANVEGAPESQSAIFSSSLGKNVGLGVSVLNDKTFIEKQTWIGIDVSYQLRFSESSTLYLGIKGSGSSYSANTQGLVTYGIGQDGSLTNFDNRFTPNVGIGALWKGQKYYITLSVPKLLTPDRLEQNNGNAYVGVSKRHMYFGGGYDFDISATTQLSLSSLMRWVEGAPISYEITSLIGFLDRFQLGLGYRINESVSGLFVFNVSNGFDLGYAYENSLHSAVDGLENGTHELFMRLKL